MTVPHLNNCTDTNRVGNGGHQAPKLTILDVIFIYNIIAFIKEKLDTLKIKSCLRVSILQVDAPRWPWRNMEVRQVGDKDRPLNAEILEVN